MMRPATGSLVAPSWPDTDAGFIGLFQEHARLTPQRLFGLSALSPEIPEPQAAE